MREFRTYGSVRGVLGNWHPYRDRFPPIERRLPCFILRESFEAKIEARTELLVPIATRTELKKDVGQK